MIGSFLLVHTVQHSPGIHNIALANESSLFFRLSRSKKIVYTRPFDIIHLMGKNLFMLTRRVIYC